MSGIPLWLHPKQMLDGSDVYIATNDRNDTYVGYIAFPLAEAEALIDPNDPAVRETIIEAVELAATDENGNWTSDEYITDAVLAALRKAAP